MLDDAGAWITRSDRAITQLNDCAFHNSYTSNARKIATGWCRGLDDEASSSSSEEDEDISGLAEPEADEAGREWGIGALAANPSEAVPLVRPRGSFSSTWGAFPPFVALNAYCMGLLGSLMEQGC